MWLDEDIETVGNLQSRAIAGVKILKSIIRIRVGIKNIIFPKTRHSYFFNGCYPQLVATQLEILREINTTLKYMYIPYFLDQTPQLLYFFAAHFSAATIWGRRLFLLEACRHQWWIWYVQVIQERLLDTVSSLCGFSVLVSVMSAVETSCTTWTDLPPAWWSSLFSQVCIWQYTWRGYYSRVVFISLKTSNNAATIRGGV